MPRGVPVACVAIDNATNAGLLAVRILSASDPQLVVAMKEYQESMRVEVMNKVDRLERDGWKNY
jgi:phosphoribosylaminoimidazole carboxylase